MYRYFIVGLMAIGILLCSVGFTEDLSPEESAIAAAEMWLKLVDDGQYMDSWDQAAEYFRAMIKQQDWEDSVKPLRESLGKVVTRTLKSREFVTTMPGAPDGEYVVIQFETSFEHKESAIETITPMVDSDGVWRVSGYFIN